MASGAVGQTFFNISVDASRQRVHKESHQEAASLTTTKRAEAHRDPVMSWKVTTHRNFYFNTRGEAFRFAISQRVPTLVEDLDGDHCWEIWPGCIPRQLY